MIKREDQTHDVIVWVVSHLFYVGRPQKKLRVKLDSNGIQQDRGWESPSLSHWVVADYAQRTNCILFKVGIGTCLNVGAWRILILLILVSSSCVAPPTEMNFHLLVSYGRSYDRQLSSLTCQHGIIPSPNTLPLNSTNGPRVHRRLAAEFINYWMYHVRSYGQQFIQLLSSKDHGGGRGARRRRQFGWG